MQSSNHSQDLASQLNQGDPKALKKIFDEYYHALWNFCNSLIHDRHAAEDIAVDTFLKLWKLRANFDTEKNIKAFLYITARNTCFNFLRHAEVERQSRRELMYLNNEMTADLEDLIDCKAIESEILKEIILEIKSLPPKMGAIFEMIFIHGLSTSEISKKMKLSSATIRVQKAKAINTIRLALAKKRLLR
jgi:RNA polymerase sigma-70 factor (family 1)